MCKSSSQSTKLWSCRKLQRLVPYGLRSKSPSEPSRLAIEAAEVESELDYPNPSLPEVASENMSEWCPLNALSLCQQFVASFRLRIVAVLGYLQ